MSKKVIKKGVNNMEKNNLILLMCVVMGLPTLLGADNGPIQMSQAVSRTTEDKQGMAKPLSAVSGFKLQSSFSGKRTSSASNSNLSVSDKNQNIQQSTSGTGLISEFLVAPAPFKLSDAAYFCYRLGSPINIDIMVYDRMGYQVADKSFASSSQFASTGYMKVPVADVITSDLPPGIYFALFKSDGEILKRTKFEIRPRG